ncbi:hypothetical protein GWK47_036623 [Chionoecetes opilio]|uniref:Uncharacterized protein n=1 Tax=Chionoecetes opilio TaxID=41210 RepID=A0A8J5CMY8_CHIOP|nr:hypothetical protein GWK47_036623 [Chionoecetes opilio]
MQLAPLQPLQHRRDVAGLCVTYKILKQGAPHLATLRQPWATPHSYSTRDAPQEDPQLIVPFARTETFFRSFLPRYSRLWNRVVRQTDMHQAATLHIFKCAQHEVTRLACGATKRQKSGAVLPVTSPLTRATFLWRV